MKCTSGSRAPGGSLVPLRGEAAAWAGACVLDVFKTVDICLPRRINEKAPRVAARRFGLFSELSFACSSRLLHTSDQCGALHLDIDRIAVEPQVRPRRHVIGG